MKINDIYEDGVIVPGVNTTVDVKPGETERQAAKFFGHGKPKELHKKARKNSDPNTLYNLGLAESVVIAELFRRKKKDVKQSDPLVVLDKVATRKDNSVFPIRMNDGSIMKIRPSTARRFIALYLKSEDEMRDRLEGLLKTKSGFREILTKLESIEFDDNLLAEAWEQLVNERNESKDDQKISAFNAKTQADIIKLKAKYPQADNILSALLADVDKNETRSEINDTEHDNKIAELDL